MAEQQESDATYSMALPAGLELGDYRILRALGQGGFGITYLAERLQDGEQVVIKENLPGDIAFRHPDSLQVIPTRTQGPQGEYARSLAAFVEEARLLARLEHPNVVKVYEAFEALNTAYYVMHWVGGTELHKAAPAPDKIDEAWLQPILRALLDALGYLHGEGVYHRDVKPANILLTPEGKPVLIDFGTARNIVSERSATHVGTPGYCPIEQVSSGGNRGPWTDVYALGATCYRLITGERPPSAEDRLVEEDDMLHPLSFRAELRGRFSAAFLQSIDKAMALRAKNRWQSTQDWVAALPKPGGNTPRRSSVNTSRIDVSSPLSQITQPQEGISAASGKSPATPVKKGKGWVVLLLLLLLGLSGAGWYGFREYERGIAAQIQAAEEAARRAEDIARQAAAEAARREEEQRQAAEESLRREEEQRLAAEESARRETEQRLAAEESLRQAQEELRANSAIEKARKKLKEKGIEPSDYNKRIVSSNIEKDLMELLIAAGADVNSVDSKGCTPLQRAVVEGPRNDIVELLLSAPGIDVNAASKDGWTALLRAAYHGYTETAKLLLKSPHIDVNKADKFGWTPLYAAALKGHVEAVRALLGADGIEVNKPNQNGVTPLLLAAQNGHVEAVRALLGADGIDVNAADKDGWTPLHAAASNGHGGVVKVLLGTPGIAVNAAKDGCTPLHIAAYMGHEGVVQALLRAPGIDVNKKVEGVTPLQIAKMNGHTAIVELILKAGGR